MNNQEHPAKSASGAAAEATGKQSPQGTPSLDHGMQSLVAKDNPDDSQLGADRPETTTRQPR